MCISSLIPIFGAPCLQHNPGAHRGTTDMAVTAMAQGQGLSARNSMLVISQQPNLSLLQRPGISKHWSEPAIPL